MDRCRGGPGRPSPRAVYHRAMPTEASRESYYVTTPIYYVNDRPHIGHCYTTILADVAARAARLIGRETFFLTGTDEHAEKVSTRAAENGVSVREWADRNAAEFEKAFAAMGCSNDDFIRTSEDRHKTRAAAFIKKLMDHGDIELGDYEGWFDPSQEEYLTETVARENDFKSPVSGRPLEKRVEQNYFFRLDKYEDRLLAAIENGDYRLLPEARRNEVLGRIKQGLQKVPVSRRIKDEESDEARAWGVKMPGDEGHRVYVWIEALLNYITAIDTEDRQTWWPASVHLLAKDILWFHAVIWPAMLMALDKPLPGIVYAHAYYIAEGVKMSKSLGNFIEIDRLETYAERYSVDALRWFLTTQGPLGSTDADFAHARFIEVYNADLANGIGNATSRVGNMIAKYFDGQVPDHGGELTGEGYDWPALTRDAVDAAVRAHGDFALDEMLRAGLELSNKVDACIGETRPFSIAKGIDKGTSADPEGDRKKLAAILYQCAEALRIASLLLSPAMPNKMAELWASWSCAPGEAPLAELAEFAGPHGMKAGQSVAKGEALFMRADVNEPAPGADA
ncbi:MAG: methionine--tRNA ligase [Planctomycetota bacterium]